MPAGPCVNRFRVSRFRQDAPPAGLSQQQQLQDKGSVKVTCDLEPGPRPNVILRRARPARPRCPRLLPMMAICYARGDPLSSSGCLRCRPLLRVIAQRREAVFGVHRAPFRSGAHPIRSTPAALWQGPITAPHPAVSTNAPQGSLQEQVGILHGLQPPWVWPPRTPARARSGMPGRGVDVHNYPRGADFSLPTTWRLPPTTG